MSERVELPRAERCEACKWWHYMKTASEREGEGVGYCYRYPPVLRNLSPVEGDFLTGDEWAVPITRDNDFCGEFSPREDEPTLWRSRVRPPTTSP